MGINSLELTRINKRVEAVNKIADPNERIKECRELFIDVLKDNSLFVVATPETTKDQWDNNRIKPYIECLVNIFLNIVLLLIFQEVYDKKNLKAEIK